MGIARAKDWVESGRYLRTRTGHRIFYRVAGKGPPLLMMHPFPTWSFDFADLSRELESEFQVITPDYLGYGFSDKPRDVPYTIGGSADMVEDLLAELGVSSVHILGHGVGCIVSQELMYRAHHGQLPFELASLMLMNCSIVFKGFQPTPLQRLVSHRYLGPVVSSLLTKGMVYRALNNVQGAKKLSPEEFDELWVGISREDGHKLPHHQLKYNHERRANVARWEDAVFEHRGPLAFIWGLADPVSGANALRLIKERAPDALTIEFPNAGHSPPVEEPAAIAEAIRGFVNRVIAQGQVAERRSSA